MPVSWLSALQLYYQRRIFIIFLLGFSSGLPLMLVFGTLSFWLREAGVSRTDIGYFSWVMTAYSIKFLWSPLADHLKLPWLHSWFGRRRSWLLLSQCLIILTICGIASTNPQTNLALLAAFAVMLAFASATQDISLDAYRIESAPENLQAALAASYLAGYRLAMILSSAGTLWLAAIFSSGTEYQLDAWQNAYLIMACCMIPCIITTLFSKEPEPAVRQDSVSYRGNTLQRLTHWFQQAIVSPFIDFFSRYKWQALVILALISCYRLSDVVMGVMANTFYVDMGFTKEEVAAVSKVYGVIMTLLGAGFGGILLNRYGTLKILFAGALLSAITNLLFCWLSLVGHDVFWLTIVISADNLSAGIATSAFIAYLSSLVNLAFTATQYALFSSLMLLFPKFLGGFSGSWAEYFGYSQFFIITALLGIPAMLLIIWLALNRKPPVQTITQNTAI